jgi:L-threonylcarbamoyladenylate synthase
VGIESTIVDLSSDRPRLLRPGSVTRSDLERVLGAPLADADPTDPTVPSASGRLASHYAPRRPLELVAPGKMASRIRELGARRVAVLAPAPADASLPAARFWSAPAGAESYAHGLYDWLHAMDASGAMFLLVEQPPVSEAWAAVRDRLQRCAATQVAPLDDAD